MTTLPEEAVKAAMDAFHEAWNNNQGLDNELPAYAHRAALTAALPFLSVQGAVQADAFKLIERMAFGYEVMFEKLCHISGTSGVDQSWYRAKAREATERLSPLHSITTESNKSVPGDCKRQYQDFMARILSALEPSAPDMGNPITDKTVKMVLAEAIAQVWYQTRDCDVEEIDRIIAHLNRNGLLIVGIQRFKMMADAIQSAAAYLALSQPNSAEKLIADLDAALKTEVGNPATEPSAARELALEEAAKIAFDISENGEYHGEASVDSTSSIYQQGAFEVYEAIRALSSQDHADAGKVEGDGWLPIESAPKDGTSILAVCAGVHERTGIPFIPEVVEWTQYGWSNEMWGEQPNHGIYSPTHWRHLPSAPSEGAE